MAQVQTLQTRFEANIIQFEAALRRMQQQNARATGAISAQHGQSARASARQWQQANVGQAISRSLNVNGLSTELSRLSGALAGVFSAGAALSAADAYARFTNSLKVAGLEGSNLTEVQGRLADIGRENATGLESLDQLYGSIAQKSRELGSSQSDILTVVGNVAMAIRVSGQSAEAAQGALLQMGQALGAGTVRAEEFNSIQEGLPTLLNAAAAASEKYAGSVAKMRADVVAGKLSSKEFMDLIMAASTALEQQASRATLTFGQSMTVLRNALVEYVGQADQSLGASAALAQGIATLAQNLDKIGAAITIVAVVLASKYSAALVTAGINSARLALFQSAMTASMMGTSRAALLAASSMRALNAATAFMGGPLGMGIAAVAVAIMAVADASRVAGETAEFASDATSRFNELMAESAEFLGDAKDNAKGYGDANAGAVGGVNALCDATAALTDETYRLANARAQALRMDIAGQIQRNRDRIEQLENPSLMTRLGRLPLNIGAGFRGGAGPGGVFGPSAGDRQVIDQLGKQNAALMAEMIRVTIDPKSQVPDRTSGGGGSAGKSRGSSGRQIDYEANDARALHDAQMAEIAARIAIAESLEERHRLEDHRIGAERQRELEQLQANDQLSAAGKAEVAATLQAAHAAEDTARERERAFAALQLAQEVEREGLDALVRIGDLNAERLMTLADLAATEGERWRLEDEAIASRRDRERRQRQLEIDQLEAQAAITRDTQERARLLAQAQTKRNEGEAQEGVYAAEDQSRRSDRRSGLQRYFDDVSTTALDQSEVMLNAFQSLESGLIGVIDGTKTLAEVWRDVASSIIADIARVAIHQMILRPIMSAMGLDFSGFGGMSKSKGGFASGTNFVSESGIYDVGENGRERVFLPRGSKVMPANVLKASERMGSAAPVMAPTYNLTTVINADNAVMRSDIDRMVAQAHIMAVQRAKAETIGELATRDRSRLR